MMIIESLTQDIQLAYSLFMWVGRHRGQQGGEDHRNRMFHGNENVLSEKVNNLRL